MNSNDAHMELVGRYFSGDATAEEVGQLEKQMLEDPQLRADFLALARVDAALPRALGGNSTLAAVESSSPAKSQWWSRAPLAVAAALLIGMFLGGGLWWWKGSKGSVDQAIVARFGELRDCRWVNSDTRVQPGDGVEIGQRIELSSGSAEVLFNNGAKLTIVGPAILEPRSAKEAFLTLGEVQLVADTPESKGFTVVTPFSKFVDIGTAFTATVSPDGLSRVEVSEGEVDVVLGDVKHTRRLKAGEILYVEPGDRQILTRIEAGDETSAFRFPTIEAPSSDDYADASQGHATVRVAHGQQLNHVGKVEVLNGGSGQSKQDAPRESVFFGGRGGGGILIDLGQPINISRINTYSWHQHDKIEDHRERARQQYTLYGFSGDEVPDIDQPLRRSGWTRIARVNSDKFFRVNEKLQRPAQQGCAISAADGDIGRFRYLLWEVKPNTFYGEFDVYGTP